MADDLLNPGVDVDGWRAASHRNMSANLTAPFAAGAVDAPLAVDAAGVVRVDGDARHPLVLVAPASALGAEKLRVSAAAAVPGAPARAPLAVEFDWFTEAGAFVPVLWSDPSAGPGLATPFTVAFTLTAVAADGSTAAVPAAQVASRLQVRLVEGLMGRMIYVAGAEKARLRRAGREVSAARSIDLSRDGSLDAAGADLGVRRFAESVSLASGSLKTTARREGDAEYRRRLALYRRFVAPGPNSVRRLLNGPGPDTGPNGGLLGAAGVKARFDVREPDTPFAFAVHLVGSGGDAARDDFLNFVRRVYLVWPQSTPDADAAHAARFLPSAARARVEALRAGLRGHFDFLPAGAALAPMLAGALDLLGRCAAALGLASRWQVTRAQDRAGGSRYELGLGVNVTPLKPADLDALTAAATAARDPKTPLPAGTDDEAAALARSLSPRSSADDPDGAWLLGACGLRTAHRVDANTLYLSHLPTRGLVILGPDRVDPPPAAPPALAAGPFGLKTIDGAVAGFINGFLHAPPPMAAFEARYQAPGDPGTNAALAAGLAAAAKAWAAAGKPAWTVLTATEQSAGWAAAAVTPTPLGVTPAQLAQAHNVFAAATGLPANTDIRQLVGPLRQLPAGLVQALRLDPATAQAVLAQAPGAIRTLEALVTILRDNGLSSILPMVGAGGEVIVTVGVIGLPQVGINLSDRRATGFRWSVVPLGGRGGWLRAAGSANAFLPAGPGLSALVVVGYARERGGVDPYEFKVDLPAGAALDFAQYEFLMNLLDRAWPAGVTVNTFAVRQGHVDVNGDGTPVALTPAVFNSFRPFRRRRSRGAAGVVTDP